MKFTDVKEEDLEVENGHIAPFQSSVACGKGKDLDEDKPDVGPVTNKGQVVNENTNVTDPSPDVTDPCPNVSEPCPGLTVTVKKSIDDYDYKSYKGYQLREPKTNFKVEHKKKDYDAELYSVPCPKCSQHFKSKYALLNHMRKHQVIRTYKCALCSDEFKTNIELIEHKKSHKDDKMTFLCTICQVAFSEHCEYLVHNLTHTNKKQYKCKECDLYYNNKNGFQIHIRTHYDKELKCNVCCKSFKSELNLISHVKTHETNLECGECGKLSTSKASFDYHMISHTGVKRHQCLYCGRCFSNRCQVRVHTRIHTNEKPFQCNICHVKFRQSTDLKRHLVTHEVNKSHECDYCGKLFFHKESIINHIRIHTNFKPFKCPVCKKKFISYQSLRAHTVYKHNKKREYSCSLCNVNYKTNVALIRHRKTKLHQNHVYGAEIKRNSIKEDVIC